MARVGQAPPAEALTVAGVRIAACVAGFHRGIAEALLAGARERLAESGLPDGALEVMWVPGAFELPLAAQAAAASGRYSAVLGLGAVVRGETPHFDYVCSASADGLQRVALDTGMPCAFGILTCDTLAQAEARAGGDRGNKGHEAADAVVAMLNLLECLRTPAASGS
jgi:6,7-dimethyl-8-ribityllumazine synthase